MADPDRDRDLAALVGEVVSVREDEAEETIYLTYADGRVVALTGLGYDGLWKYVLVMP